MADSTITISLDAGGATYDTYHMMFRMLAGKADWQRPIGTPTGWNIALNGEDVRVLDVNDDGFRVQPVLDDDDWTLFGEPKDIPWDDIDSINIY